MLFTGMCRTAIKSCIFIALHSKRGTIVNVQQIAREINENEHSIAKILQGLAKANIVESIKGVKGGFMMSEKQLGTPMLELVRMMDESFTGTKCVLGLQKCDDVKPCPLHPEYLRIRGRILTILNENTIEGFANKVEFGKSFLLN